ncbi:MAG: hypothetical protein V3W14_04955 [Candidatus Neomarinimicrobiota bacterium]
MKDIIIGVIGAAMLFFILVVVFSVAIIFYGGEEGLAELTEGRAIPMVPERDLLVITQARDSLLAETAYLGALVANQSTKVDSLLEQLSYRDAANKILDDRVQNKDVEIAILREVGLNAQEMARTFATMKVDELTPIVSRLSDGVVLDIYKQTANKRRKFLLTALGDERAAAMTNRLVKQKGS